LIKPGTRRNQMVLTVDFAPTLIEVAGGAVPAGLHGKSFAPLFAANGPALREAFLVEHFSENVFPRTRQMGYRAIRSEAWKYIHYVDLPNADELYDLNRDPYEMRNLIASAGHAPELKRLRDELAKLEKEAGPGPR
jgi:N-acetylglucosamine-6-sulfatase